MGYPEMNNIPCGVAGAAFGLRPPVFLAFLNGGVLSLLIHASLVAYFTSLLAIALVFSPFPSLPVHPI